MDIKKYAREITSLWAHGNYIYVKWAAEHGVNYYEMMVLCALDIHTSMTQKEIGDYCGMPKQTVNNIIRNYKTMDYVVLTASDWDKREKIVSFTDSGRRYADAVLAPLNRLEERVYRAIGIEKLEQMIEISGLFNTLFDKEMEKEKQNDRE